MKTHFLCLLLALQTSFTLAQEPLAVWKASDASVNGVIQIGESSGGPSLLGSDVGVTIENDEEKGKVLRFAGTEGVLTSDGMVHSSDRMRVSVVVRLEGNPTSGTILRSNMMELQHSGRQRSISFIVWHDGGHTAVTVPQRTGEWVTVTCTVDGNTMRLEMDGESAEAEIQGVYQLKPGIVQVGMGLDRPLLGDISEICIEELQE